MWKLLYGCGIHLFALGIRIASIWNKKARAAIVGRRENGLEALQEWRRQLPAKQKIYWFHCASLGEYEQGLPLVKLLKEREPNTLILLTFFSPSGFKNYKPNPAIAFVAYLPFDTAENAVHLVEIGPIEAVFVVKYEFWFNWLNALREKQVKVYLVSGLFHGQQPFFKWYGGWMRKQLGSFEHFFVQDDHSRLLLENMGYLNVSVSGDTRFDRVLQIAENPNRFDLIEKFCKDHFTIVAGSTWPEDELLLRDAMALQSWGNRVKIILVPHEIGENHIVQLEQQTKGQRWTKVNALNVNEKNVLIVDAIGMLSSLYQYATIAYIGGGFGTGIHNVLEAAVFGRSTIFGPNYLKYIEAVQLIELNGAFSVSSVKELGGLINRFITEPDFLHRCGKISEQFVVENSGVSEQIYSFISGKC